jgi:hypothetical protein
MYTRESNHSYRAIHLRLVLALQISLWAMCSGGSQARHAWTWGISFALTSIATIGTAN